MRWSKLSFWAMLYIDERLDLTEYMYFFYDRAEKSIPLRIKLEKMRDFFQTATTPYPEVSHRINKISEIKDAIERITEYLENAYFPVINQINSFENIYAHIQNRDENNPFGLNGESRIIQLLLAYLAKVKDLEAVIDDIRNDLSTQLPVYTERFEKTLELIKQDQLKNG